MTILEDRLVFYPHASKSRDLEKASIGQVTRRIPPGHQPVGLLLMQLRKRSLVRNLQNLCLTPVICRRVQRKEGFEVSQTWLARLRIGLDGQIARLQHGLKIIAENRQGQAPRPVDIEMARISAFRTMLDHILPPRRFKRCRHVIGNDIENETEPRILQRLDHAVEASTAADRGIDLIRVGNVVAMCRFRCRREDR